DNPPLRFAAVAPFQLNRYLLAYLEKGKAYTLRFGDSTAQTPVYDLQYFKDSIGSAVMPLAYGKPERNKPEAPAPAPPGNRWLIWVALGAACIVLLLLTAKMLGAINKRNT
ncbi:MAG TPA: hypothetical protein VLD19_17225, partial [Chitinophagaceae bacterium]|nr:hypothetical protein [Chitinophagaceae bacterium]